MTAVTAPGQIETCRACRVSFATVPDESMMVLTLRYTKWRESHQACVLDEPEPVKVRVKRRRKRAGAEGS